MIKYHVLQEKVLKYKLLYYLIFYAQKYLEYLFKSKLGKTIISIRTVYLNLSSKEIRIVI